MKLRSSDAFQLKAAEGTLKSEAIEKSNRLREKKKFGPPMQR